MHHVSHTGPNTFGTVTFWELSAQVDRLACVEAFSAAGFPGLIKERSLPDIVRAALVQCYETRGERVIVRSLGRNGGYQVTREDRTGRENQYRNPVQAMIEKDVLTILGCEAFGEYSAIESAIEVERLILRPSDTGMALRGAARAIYGASLRPGGGVYWIPASGLPKWDLLAGAMQSVGAGKVYVIDHPRDSDSTRAVLDAVAREALQEISEIENGTHAEVGERGLQARAQDARDLTARLAEYEQILGESLADLRAQAEKAGNAAATAALLAMATKAQKARAKA